MNAAEVSILVRARDEASAVFNKVKGAASGLGSTMGTVLKVGSIAAAGGLVAAGAAAVKFIGDASSLAESLSKVRVVFGSSAGDIEKWASTSAQSLGQTRQQALEMAGTFGNLFDALGLNQDQAVKMSKSVVELGTDLASFNNIGTDVALEKIRAGLVGEAEPLRALGVNLTAATTEAKAMQLGLEKVNGEFTDAAKVQARYAIILEQTKNAQGDFARTSGGLANQQRILGAEWGNLKAQLGTALMPVMLLFVSVLAGSVVPALSSAATHFGNFIEMIRAALSGEVAQAGALFATLPAPLQQIALWLAANKDEIISFLRGVKDAAVVVGGILLAALRGWLNIALELAPHLATLAKYIAEHKPLLIALAVALGIVVVALVGIPALILLLIVAIGLLADKWDEIKAKTLEVWDAIPTPIREGLAIIAALVEFYLAGIKNTFELAWAVIGGIVRTVMALMRGDFDQAGKELLGIATAFLDFIRAEFDRWKELVLSIVSSAWDILNWATAGRLGEWAATVSRVVGEVGGFFETVLDPIQWVIDRIYQLIEAIRRIPKPDLGPIGGFIGGSLSALPGRAMGGYASGWTLVGERGPEVVKFPPGSYVHSNADSRELVGGNTQTIYIDRLEVHGDPREALAALGASI